MNSEKRTLNAQQGFTLLELLMALTLIAMSSAMIYMAFFSVTRAWRTGMDLAEDLHHGDFVLDQLTLGLRSAYFPETGGKVTDYGFWLEDNGSGEGARDSISWVKRGSALLSSGSDLAAGVHRVKFSIEDDADGEPAAAVRCWRFYTAPEDFDPASLEPDFISKRVVGFDCRVATNLTDSFDRQEWEWAETWEDEDTNRLPIAVELTMYLSPLKEGGTPIELKRCVEIPVWQLSRRGTQASPNQPNAASNVARVVRQPGGTVVRQPGGKTPGPGIQLKK